jgi:ammonia channel protein AmtB
LARIDTGDTAFMLVSSALVPLTTFGLGFFYGGLARKNNVLTMMTRSFVSLGLVTAIWVVVGYSLAFGPDRGGFIVGLDFAGLRGVGSAPSFAPPAAGSTIPHSTSMVLQLMFAIITPALITGAFADRKRFSRWMHFVALCLLVICVPIAHWVWGGGRSGDHHPGIRVRRSLGGDGHRDGRRVVCYLPTKLRARMKWDDSLDVWACHGVGGTIGVICTGPFADAEINGKDGLIYGGGGLSTVQIAEAGIVAALSFFGTCVILKLISLGGPIQVPWKAEESGLDRHEHGEAEDT